jgi:hydrogenase expression/formation protein HypE
MGAVPKYITAGFILEEGLEFAVLERIVTSMKVAADEASVEIIAGDTKVVEKGKADGLYINTTGVGLVKSGTLIRGDQAKPDDVVIVSGPIGDHGIAVLEARGNLGFETEVQSDIAPLNRLVASMLEVSKEIHVMRDPTRGGIASALNEIAKQSQVCIHLEENLIPVRGPVQAACEILGFDPLYIANEGKLLAFVGREDVDGVLMAMRNNPYGKRAAVIGHVQNSPAGRVLMKTALGSTRVVDVLAGEMLPRIC